VIVEHLLHDLVEAHRRQLQAPTLSCARWIVEQALDQLLQLHALLLQDSDDSRCSDESGPAVPSASSSDPSPKRRQRRCQL